jgi:hypothetical protein
MSMVFRQFPGHPCAHNPPVCQIWKVVELRALFVYSKELLSVAVMDNLVQLHAPRVGGVHSYLRICVFGTFVRVHCDVAFPWIQFILGSIHLMSSGLYIRSHMGIKGLLMF